MKVIRDTMSLQLIRVNEVSLRDQMPPLRHNQAVKMWIIGTSKTRQTCSILHVCRLQSCPATTQRFDRLQPLLNPSLALRVDACARCFSDRHKSRFASVEDNVLMDKDVVWPETEREALTLLIKYISNSEDIWSFVA